MDTSEQVKIVQQDDGLLLVKSAVQKALWEMIQPFDAPDQLAFIENLNSNVIIDFGQSNSGQRVFDNLWSTEEQGFFKDEKNIFSEKIEQLVSTTVLDEKFRAFAHKVEQLSINIKMQLQSAIVSKDTSIFKEQE